MSSKKISEDLNNDILLKVLTKVIILIGVKEISLVEKSVMLDYIRKYLGHYAPQEILLAFEMAMQGRLNCDTKAYGVLSSQLVQDVMDAYKNHTYEIRKNIDAKQPAPEQQWTSADEDALYSKSIRDLYEKYKADKNVWDGNWPGKHDWLAKKGAIPLRTTDKAEFDQLQKEALKMWIKDTDDKMMKAKNAGEVKRLKDLLTTIRAGDVGNHREMVLPLYAKEIKVKRYFDKLISEGK